MDARETAILTLGLYYSLRGYVRGPIPARVRNDRSRYHKYWEVRIYVPLGEFDFLRSVIDRAGFRVVQPFEKRDRIVQPIYGYGVVATVVRAAGREPL